MFLEMVWVKYHFTLKTFVLLLFNYGYLIDLCFNSFIWIHQIIYILVYLLQ